MYISKLKMRFYWFLHLIIGSILLHLLHHINKLEQNTNVLNVQIIKTSTEKMVREIENSCLMILII